MRRLYVGNLSFGTSELRVNEAEDLSCSARLVVGDGVDSAGGGGRIGSRSGRW